MVYTLSNNTFSNGGVYMENGKIYSALLIVVLELGDKGRCLLFYWRGVCFYPVIWEKYVLHSICNFVEIEEDGFICYF